MSSDNEDKMDMYGFSNNVTYDRKNDYPVLKPDISARKFAMYLVIGILIFFLLFAGVIAGYHAWNEFPNDSNISKIIKTYVAVIFSPIYLLYVFLKVQFFKSQ
jgi:hypothetical protein